MVVDSMTVGVEDIGILATVSCDSSCLVGEI